jgi:uncharacterized flavoprotein (TIGR03862 family)
MTDDKNRMAALAPANPGGPGPQTVVVVGGGPAGLMAAEVLSAAGIPVSLYDAMPTAGRKFLLAGKGGLNLTHSEPIEIFQSRYGARQNEITALLRGFGPTELREWAGTLGIASFVGSSGRVFPTDMKAAPLLRAWLHRLRHPVTGAPVQFHMRHRWTGWEADSGTRRALVFETPQGKRSVDAHAIVLALGGASWARLGSDGAWVTPLRERGVQVASLVPANCGFEVDGGWSAHFGARFAGMPFKSVAIGFVSRSGEIFQRKGEFVATATGVEGSLIYAASGLLRNEIAARGHATLTIDLLPALSPERVLTEVKHPRGSRSLSSHIKSRLGIDGIKAGLLNELLARQDLADPAKLAAGLKALPLTLVATRPIDEAISSAGGVCFESMDGQSMLTHLPGVFCAGEMLDWEAPTGGYLLTASMASGRVAARGVLDWLDSAEDASVESVESHGKSNDKLPAAGVATSPQL